MTYNKIDGKITIPPEAFADCPPLVPHSPKLDAAIEAHRRKLDVAILASFWCGVVSCPRGNATHNYNIDHVPLPPSRCLTLYS